MFVDNHQLVFEYRNQPLALNIVDSSFVFKRLDGDNRVNILASGPSIDQMDMTKISEQPAIFVNGSLILTETYTFLQPVGYVITDPRFIKHNLSLILKNYTGFCPLYISDLVAEQLLADAPAFLATYHAHIFVIFPIKRPVLHRPIDTTSLGFFKKIATKLYQRPRLKHFKNSPYHTIHKKIGVSFDIRHGFVEGGTVAYVALQLAYTLGFKDIHLYGIDLLNSSTPRFYETAQNAAPSKLDQAISNRIVPSFELASQQYQKHGGRIINHSFVSKDLFKSIVYQPA